MPMYKTQVSGSSFNAGIKCCQKILNTVWKQKKQLME